MLSMSALDLWCLCYFFFNDTATTEIYTLSLHDALPICLGVSTLRQIGYLGKRAFLRSIRQPGQLAFAGIFPLFFLTVIASGDRKSTRLNSSHANISYAVFCLKKKTAGKETV